MTARVDRDANGREVIYLDASYRLYNRLGDGGGFAPPVNRPFDIQVKWHDNWSRGLECPFRAQSIRNCLISTTFNRFSAQERLESAQGTNAISPPSGRVQYGLIIVVDPDDAVKETNDNDNRFEIRVTVSGNQVINQTIVR